jgi:hypothetical protein
VSVDQYISALPGQLPQEMKKGKYYSVTILSTKNQVSLNARETAIGKGASESVAMSTGVRMIGYHADNLPFNTEEWKNNMRSKNQELSLSGPYSSPEWCLQKDHQDSCIMGSSNGLEYGNTLARSSGFFIVAVCFGVLCVYLESPTNQITGLCPE